MSSDPLAHSPIRQTKSYWLYVCFVPALIAIFVGARFVNAGESLGLKLGGILGGLVLAAVIIGVYAVRLRNRLKNAAREFPGALLIPVAVGAGLATTSQRLATAAATPTLRMTTASYGVIAVDGSGLHLSATGRRGWGHIPVAQVMFVGFTSTVLGIRYAEALVLRVELGGESFDLPIVALRMRGNPLKSFRPNELDGIAGDIQSALRGYPHDGWNR